jgi:hypothetical protein
MWVWFSPQLVSETFPIVSRIKRDIIISVHRSSCRVPVICHILIKLEYS